MAGSKYYGTKGSYVYTDDQGNTWTVRLWSVIAQAGGFSAGIGGNGPWPFHQKNMRRMDGVDANGHRVRIPVATTANANWESAPNVTVNYLTGARTYTVTGFTGERKWIRYVA
ncbi:MAG TPA: hypothetical protein VJP80_00380 [Candidatus Saccharimonadales bacterium]|nr:hypothetical protein [Candidatus Saccharimonadales bacterium]